MPPAPPLAPPPAFVTPFSNNGLTALPSPRLQVRANHVFLLEPALDPAIEQQAVARVHRIGQTRDVSVTRLLVDDSVERHVMAMLKVGGAVEGGRAVDTSPN